MVLAEITKLETVKRIALSSAVLKCVWYGNMTRLEEIAQDVGFAGIEGTKQVLDMNFSLREKKGHYLGAVLEYVGIFYWGVDR